MNRNPEKQQPTRGDVYNQTNSGGSVGNQGGTHYHNTNSNTHTSVSNRNEATTNQANRTNAALAGWPITMLAAAVLVAVVGLLLATGTLSVEQVERWMKNPFLSR